MATEKHSPREKSGTITRWDEWFSEASLSKDERILSTAPSKSAVKAALEFRARRKRHILDLACGIGRDTRYLESQGLNVTGVDASTNGLQAARHIGDRKDDGLAFAAADARCLPFKNGSFEGVFCFGLLHEFTSARGERDVEAVMEEIGRLLNDDGVLVLSVLSGEPGKGLPHVQMFSRQMFNRATRKYQRLKVTEFDDVGCTGRPDYRVWYGVFVV